MSEAPPSPESAPESASPVPETPPPSARERARAKYEKLRAKRKLRRERRAHKLSFRRLGSACVAGGVLAALFLIANQVLGTAFFAPKIDAAFFLLYAALAAGTAWAGRRFLRREPRPRGIGSVPWEDLVFLAFLGLVTVTTFTHHRGYHFIAWPLYGKTAASLLRSRMVHFLALSTALSVPFLAFRSRRWLDWVLPALLVATELLCAHALWKLTGGLAVWSDDHPSFLFRVQEFWHSFPWRENYVPHWNGGVVNAVITSSGTPGYAFLTAPLRLLSTQPHATHTAGLYLIHALIVPWTIVWGMRANRWAWRAAWTAALLALFANRVFFLWAFHYGTAGFGCAVVFTPAAFLFLHAIAEKRFVTLGNVLGLVFSMTFLCQWPPMCAVAAILALAALTSWRRWLLDGRTLLALALSGAVVLWLLYPTLHSAIAGKGLISYTTSGRPALSWAKTPLRIWRALRLGLGDMAFKMHPLVLVLGFGGLWALQEKPLRRWLAIATLGLWAFFSVGTATVPKMQLARMVIPSAMLAVVPAAVHAGRIWRDRRASVAFLPGAVLALLLLGIPNIAKLYQGLGFAPFRAMPSFVSDLAGWIRDNVPEGSRFLFAGRTLHAYGRGHVAYLPLLANREMMSCDYYDFPHGTFEPDYPPKASRAEPGGMHAFMVRHGVSHAIAFRPGYVEYFQRHPELYESVPEFEQPKWGRFRVFRVKGSHDVFLEGRGRVESDFNRLRVTFPGAAPGRAVIAYNWNDRLEADPPAEIAPFETGTTLGPDPAGCDQPVRFIEIRPNGSEEVVIRYRPRF